MTIKTNFKPITPIKIRSTTEVLFEKLAICIVGPLPLTESGNRFLLTA